MARRPETPEQIAQRQYRERMKDISADRLVPFELYRLWQAIDALSENTAKWQAEIRNSVETGFEKVAKAITEGLPPRPGPPVKVESVKFVFPRLREGE